MPPIVELRDVCKRFGGALVQDAKLIILDEHTTALTQLEVDALFEIVNKLKARGVALLFVSHKLREM